MTGIEVQPISLLQVCVKALCTRSEYGQVSTHICPFSSLCSLLQMDTMMLINEQSEVLVEGRAQCLPGSSLNSDDNLIARKGILETCFDSAFIQEALCFYFLTCLCGVAVEKLVEIMKRHPRRPLVLSLLSNDGLGSSLLFHLLALCSKHVLYDIVSQQQAKWRLYSLSINHLTE